MKKTLEKFEEETHKVATHAARSELVHYLEEPGYVIMCVGGIIIL